MSAERTRLIAAKLKWLRSFVVYARYELQPGTSQPGDQFPRQADADRALSEIDAIAEALAGQEDK